MELQIIVDVPDWVDEVEVEQEIKFKLELNSQPGDTPITVVSVGEFVRWPNG